MIRKSLLTASIAALLGSTSLVAQEQLFKLQNTKFHDRSKGKGNKPSKKYLKGSIYTQKTGPFNTKQEQERRLRKLASQVQS